MITRPLALLACLWLAALGPTPLLAQEDDRGVLQGLLEGALSGPGRTVTLSGFDGALSREATIAEIRVEDETGLWLSMENVRLAWDRTALLARRVEVQGLRAARVTLHRRPDPTPGTAPKAEASAPFVLPDLPVALTLGTLSIDTLVLGEPVLGQRVEAQISGSANLIRGEGTAALTVTRLDRPGDILFSGAFSNETRALALDLTVTEPEGGLAASLLGLAETPALALDLKGEGSTSDFAATLSLTVAEADRLGGTLILTEHSEGADVGFKAALTGDLAPLLQPDLRPFFEGEMALDAEGLRHADGGFALTRLAVDGAMLSLAGQAEITPDGWPSAFDLTAQVADPSGAPLRLPLSGAPVLVRGLALEARYAAASGDQWTVSGQVSGLATETLDLDRAAFSGKGQIRPDLKSIKGAVALTSQGLVPSDPALARGLGSALSGSLFFDWRPGDRVQISDLTLGGSDYQLAGDLTAQGLRANADGLFDPMVTTDLDLSAENLSRFAALVGLDLRGEAELTLGAEVFPLRGAFDLSISGLADGLAFGIAPVDSLIRGPQTLDLILSRDETGLALRALTLMGRDLTAQVSGRLGGSDGALDVTARLRDLGLILPDLPGPTTLTAKATQSGDAWQTEARVNAPGNASLRASGQVASDASRVDLHLEGVAPLALLNPRLAPQSLSGQANLDLHLVGAPELGNLSGTISTEGTRLTLPDLGISLDGLRAEMAFDDGRAMLNAGARASAGGKIRLSGPISLIPPYRTEITTTLEDLVLRDAALFEATTEGTVTLSGALAETLRLSGTLTLPEVEIRIPDISASAGPLDGLEHVGAPSDVLKSLRFAGMDPSAHAESSASAGLPLDLRINAPRRIFVRGRGLDAELGGALHLTGDTSNIIPEGQISLIRGRMDLLGNRLDLSEGQVSLRGSYDPVLYFAARSDIADGTEVSLIVEGLASDPEVSARSVPELPQDQALALLLFGRPLSGLTTFQAVQLASAVQVLSGGKGLGLLSTLRTELGVDDLDLVAAEDGTAQARVGKYLSEDVYTDVRIGAAGDTQINLNLDLSPDVTLRGRLGPDEESGIGLFFERDY